MTRSDWTTGVYARPSRPPNRLVHRRVRVPRSKKSKKMLSRLALKSGRAVAQRQVSQVSFRDRRISREG